jgi:D-alanine-D-alanine ligase
MHISILYNQPSADASADDLDVLVQRDGVAAALGRLGHSVTDVPCSLDLDTAHRKLAVSRPDVVFNLVESLGGSDRMMPLATVLLDGLHIPYTGCHTAAILSTSDKLRAKLQLVAAGLPTPAWFAAPPAGPTLGGEFVPGRYILKAVAEHASIGLDDAAVVEVANAEELPPLIHDRSRRIGRPCFAEQFIDGREFNLSLLHNEDAAQVLPPAEIDFSALPAGKPHIVGYAAKWDSASVEYEQTPRRFDFPATDDASLGQLAELAKRCWTLFDLRGYARVDFRLDVDGQPWILEVNANPCLSPDAGFAAAVERAGIPFDAAIVRILQAAL